ncbi:DUF6624 domain-containing protein [Lentzea sp. JNUCC 0626]|uniref:DUF6624 domain-containing protein n=1 Tax=Lentzea sp. JNUCC 0626 TaxID=3367513 RepID=UPI00374911F9
MTTTVGVHVLARFHDGWRMCVAASSSAVVTGAVQQWETPTSAALRHVVAKTGYEGRLVAALSPDGRLLPLSEKADLFVAVVDRAYLQTVRVESVSWLRLPEAEGANPLAALLFGQIDDVVARPPVERDEDLRRELLHRYAKDEESRFAWWVDRSEANRQRVRQVDRENTPWLKEIVRQRGWPGIALVGAEAAEAAWSLILHADLDRAFQLDCVDLLAVEVTGGAAPAKHLAHLEDRVRVHTGRPQIFATLVWTDDEGRAIAYSTVDTDTVRQRRADWGLADLPLAEFEQAPELS